jgi:hypothetical protein
MISRVKAGGIASAANGMPEPQGKPYKPARTLAAPMLVPELAGRRVRMRPIEGVAEIATLVACDRFAWGVGLVVLADEEFRDPIGDDGLRECCSEIIAGSRQA